MHPMYADSVEIADRLREARLRVIQLSQELSQADYDLEWVQAKVERSWIKKAGGEKELAPTAEDRRRIFVLALEADEGFRTQLEHRNRVKFELEQAKVEASALQDRLRIALAAMAASGDG